MAGTGKASVYQTLDGLRGLGAIMVVIAHTMLFWGWFVKPAAPICVDLFFLLSGFVIAFSFEPKFAKGMRVKEFMTHRIVRLYPLYFLGLMMGLAVALGIALLKPDPASEAGIVLGQFLPELVMLPSPDLNGSGDFYALNVPAWTLFFELVVNLVYVLIWPRLSTRVVIGIVAAMAVTLAATVAWFGTLDVGVSWATATGAFARAGFSFFGGVLVYRLAGSPRAPHGKRSWLSIGLIVLLPVVSIIPASPQWRPVLDLFIVVVAAMPLLWLAQRVEPPRMFGSMFLVLGRISYAVYALHYPVWEAMKRLAYIKPELYQVYAPWTGAAILVFSLVLAYLAERFYDRPVRRFVVRLLKARAMQQATPAARMVPAE